MTYIELLLFVQERGEKILGQDIRSLITDKHRYIRDLEQESWFEDKEPGSPEKHTTRSGEIWVWKRQELPPEEVQPTKEK